MIVLPLIKYFFSFHFEYNSNLCFWLLMLAYLRLTLMILFSLLMQCSLMLYVQ